MKKFGYPAGMVLGAVFSAATLSAAPYEYQKYFPLNVGNEWTHTELNVAPRIGTEAMTSITSSGDNFYFVSGFPGLEGGVWLTFGRNTLYAWNAETSSWNAFLRFGATVGTRYTVNLGTLFWNDVTVTVANKNLTVRNPILSESETRCVEFTVFNPHVADAGIESLVFAPEIGLVKLSTQAFRGPVTSWLKRCFVGGNRYGMIPMTTLQESFTTQNNPTNQVLVINSQTALRNFYRTYKPGQPVPTVNFSRKTVVAALPGMDSNPYRVAVVSVKYGAPAQTSILVTPIPPNVRVMGRPYQLVTLDWKISSITADWTIIQP